MAVPTYVIGGRWSIPGAQEPDVFVQVLRRVAERAERAG
jgi:predicted DsbA family dithiol-disulfide isomerase